MKKDQIIEVARKLFCTYGFQKVSMDQIAKEANVTKKTIYVYFKNKEDLFDYFVKEELTNMKNIVEKIEKKNLEFFDSVNKIIYQLLKYRKSKDFIKNITHEAELLKNPLIIKKLQVFDDQIQSYIKTKLQKAKENGYIFYQDVDITAFLVYKMYIALMFEWNDKSKKLDEQMIANSISEIIKNGLRKEVDQNEEKQNS